MSGLDVGQALTAAGIIVQIFFIDLLLSADNALMIALACRALPPADMRRAALFGTVGAIGLRVLMAAIVLFVLQAPYLKIVAGALLLGIAIKLTIERDDPAEGGPRPRADLLGVIAAIIVADAVMSLDNVVAIAAVAQGSLPLLAFGLALSIPMLVYGSTLIRGILDGSRWLVLLAGMFLGWIAGSLGVSDPAVAAWVAVSAPALAVAVPLACAVFVLWEARILAPFPDRRAEILTLELPEGELDAG